MANRPEEELLVHSAAGEVEAQLFRSLFENHGIRCRFQGEALRLTHMFTVDGLGRVDLYVCERDADRARALIAAVEQGELTLEEDLSGGPGTPRERWKDLP